MTPDSRTPELIEAVARAIHEGERAWASSPGAAWDGCRASTREMRRVSAECVLIVLDGREERANERLRDALQMLRDACGHCLAGGRPPNQQMIDNADEVLRRG